MLKKILGQLRFKQDTKKKAKVSHGRPSYIVPVPELVHRYRDTNINEGEGAFLSFKGLWCYMVYHNPVTIIFFNFSILQNILHIIQEALKVIIINTHIEFRVVTMAIFYWLIVY